MAKRITILEDVEDVHQELVEDENGVQTLQSNTRRFHEGEEAEVEDGRANRLIKLGKAQGAGKGKG